VAKSRGQGKNLSKERRAGIQPIQTVNGKVKGGVLSKAPKTPLWKRGEGEICDRTDVAIT
jgi:hypothetical protein